MPIFTQPKSLKRSNKGSKKLFLGQNLFQLMYNHNPKSNWPFRKNHKTADRKGGGFNPYGQPDRKISAFFYDFSKPTAPLTFWKQNALTFVEEKYKRLLPKQPFLQTRLFLHCQLINTLQTHKCSKSLDKTSPKDHDSKICVKVPATSFVQWVLGSSSN